jgi:N-acetylglucosaminyl-diphospho-decaprenol L-rhamnosyltransferase
MSFNHRATSSEGNTIRLGVVLVAYKSNEVLSECLDALTAALRSAGLAQPESVTVIVVNNDSKEAVNVPSESVWKQIVIDSDTNLGFSPAVNLALTRIADVDYVLLLNPDACLAPHSLSVMVKVALERRAAIVGPLLTDQDGRPHGVSERPFHSIPREMGRQLLGIGRASPPYGRKAARDGVARCLTGACLLIEREFLAKVGGLDTATHMYLEDVILCWQAHAAQRSVILALDARCQHALGGSTGGTNFQSSVALYLTLLGARVEFVRRRTGVLGALAMRSLFVVGACLRSFTNDAARRRVQQAVIWWAIRSGKAPEWENGPRIKLPSSRTLL